MLKKMLTSSIIVSTYLYLEVVWVKLYLCERCPVCQIMILTAIASKSKNKAVHFIAIYIGQYHSIAPVWV